MKKILPYLTGVVSGILIVLLVLFVRYTANKIANQAYQKGALDFQNAVLQEFTSTNQLLVTIDDKEYTLTDSSGE